MCATFSEDSNNQEEIRRKCVVAEKKTDLERWSNPKNLDPSWQLRAQFAARFIPPQVAVLDLGCGAMDLERFLSASNSYIPCDLVSRDERTLICDFSKNEFPRVPGLGIVTVLGVLEYILDVPSFLRSLWAFEVPIILSYCPTDFTGHVDREAQGWVNHFSLSSIDQLIETSGFKIAKCEPIDEVQRLFYLEPILTDPSQK